MTKPLLAIELETIDSVPKVYYKGEEITGKVHIGFAWATQTYQAIPSPMIDIKYVDTSSNRPNIISIGHNPLGGDQS